MLWISVYMLFCCYHSDSVRGEEIEKCDSEKFHQPYVRLYKKRTSSFILKELDRSGFIDLTGTIDHFLCVNGPAIEYRDVVYADEIKPKSQRKFKNNAELLLSTEDEDPNINEGDKLSDEALDKVIEEVDAIQESMESKGGNGGSSEALMKILKEVENTVDAIEDKMENEEKPTNKNDDSKSEILPENMKDPTPELLEKVLNEISKAKAAIDELNMEDGVRDPTADVLGIVISDITAVKNVAEACARDHTGATKDVDCLPSSDILANVIAKVNGAKKSLEKVKDSQNDNIENPSTNLLNQIIKEVSDTKDAVDSNTRGSDTTNTNEGNAVQDPTPQLLVNIIKDISEAKGAIDKLSNSGNEKDPSSDILATVISEAELAKNEFEACVKRDASSNSICKSTPDILKRLSERIKEAKQNLPKVNLKDEDGLDNPSADLLGQILEEVIAVQNFTKIEQEKGQNGGAAPPDNDGDGITASAANSKEDEISSDQLTGRKTSNFIMNGGHGLSRKQRQRLRRHKRRIGTKSNGNKVAIFKDGELHVYNHECFIVNHATRKVFLSSKRSLSKMKLTRSMEVVGKKTFGITLIGHPDDYREPEIYQFSGKKFEYIVDGVHTSPGNSFITIGKMNSWCHKTTEQDLKLHPDDGSPGEVCQRGGGHPEFDNLFPVGKKTSDYDWKICDKKLSAGTESSTPSLLVYKHFATMDREVIKNGKGSGGVPHPPPDIPAFVPNFLISNMEAYNPPTINTSMTENKVEEVVYPAPNCKNVTTGVKGGNSKAQKTQCVIDVDHCLGLPSYDEGACKDDGPTVDDPCVYLNSVMNLTDEKETEEKVNEYIQWKLPVLNLIDTIFNKICTKVNPEMAPSVSRLMFFYLTQAHDNEGTLPTIRRKTWDFLESELSRCEESAQEMLFSWHSGSDVDDVYSSGKKRRRKREAEVKQNNKRHAMTKININLENDNIIRFRRADGESEGGGTENKGTEGGGSENKGTEGGGSENKGTEGGGSENKGTEGGGTVSKGGAAKRNGENGNSTGESGEKNGGGEPGGDTESTDDFGGLNQPVQEIFEEPLDPDNYIYPENVSIHMYNMIGKDRIARADNGKPKYGKAIPIYYFEDAAELNNDLSIPIDLHFKVFATVAGYCNLFYVSRKSETFPRLYSTYYEDIFSPLETTWLKPKDSATMKFLFSEYSTEPVTKWLDSCLEGSYLVSSSPTFRPPRPLIIKEKDKMVANYFIDEPPHKVNSRRDNPDIPEP